MKIRPFTLAMALGALLLTARPASAVVADSAFAETTYVSGIKQLTAMAWAPDGSNRLFVLQKGGAIRIVQNGALLPTAFATLSPITTSVECGLLGIAFDPNFLDNGYVYVFVTVSASEQQIIRYTANGNSGEDKTPIVVGLPTAGANHDGGALGFGADGKLYWGVGDNGNAMGVDADLESLASKIGRANRDGTAPADNPFFDGPGPNNDYIWARGFRNPFTLTFQPTTGRMWLNVVGTVMEQIFTPSAGDHGGWNDYESNQPAAGYIAPVASYWTDKAPAFAIAATGATRNAGITRISTTIVHRLRPGATVTVAGVGDATFNGTVVIASVEPRAFSFAQAGPDAQSGGGTATPDAIGGAITGGEFWNSSGVPLEYRNDFFFADYNADSVTRVRLNVESGAGKASLFSSAQDRIVDIALGPDGAFYFGTHLGSIVRAAYTFPAQGLVVSPLNVRVDEGGRGTFAVRLATAPIADVTVKVSPFSGENDVSVTEGATLTFTTANWTNPQRVVVSAANDADSIDDAARLRVSSSGLTAEVVEVSVTDGDAPGLVVVPSSLELSEGSSSGLGVSMTQPPAGSLDVALVIAGDASLTVSPDVLSFNAQNWSFPQTATVSSAEDEDALDGAGQFKLSATGLATRDIAIVVRDNDPRAPSITSAPPSTVVLGQTYTYDIDADAVPAAAFGLEDGPLGMSIAASSGVIEWTPETLGSYAVVARAGNGVPPDAVQAFEIDVLPDAPPTCSLSAPLQGDQITGTDAEFFGDVTDDVATVRAEFFVDDELLYADVNDSGHYHLGGTHNLFDTTQLSNGEHAATMKGYDSAGQTCVDEVTFSVSNAVVGVGGAADGGGSSVISDGGALVSDGGEAETIGGAAGRQGESGATGGRAEAGSSIAESDNGSGCDCRFGETRMRPPHGCLVVAIALLVRRRRTQRATGLPTA